MVLETAIKNRVISLCKGILQTRVTHLRTQHAQNAALMLGGTRLRGEHSTITCCDALDELLAFLCYLPICKIVKLLQTSLKPE